MTEKRVHRESPKNVVRVSVHEAAHLLPRDEATVIQEIKAGGLKAIGSDGAWRIALEDIEEYKKNRAEGAA